MKFLKFTGIGTSCLVAILTFTSFKVNNSSSLGISHYVIRAGVYIHDGNAMAACDAETFNSQIKLEEIENDLYYSKAWAVFDYPIYWSDPVPVNSDIPVHVNHSGTIDYCECWIKHDPVLTIEKVKR
ncbi:hypothetical protein [Chryseobacterium sp. Marseille-Q8038]